MLEFGVDDERSPSMVLYLPYLLYSHYSSKRLCVRAFAPLRVFVLNSCYDNILPVVGSAMSEGDAKASEIILPGVYLKVEGFSRVLRAGVQSRGNQKSRKYKKVGGTKKSFCLRNTKIFKNGTIRRLFCRVYLLQKFLYVYALKKK